MKTQRGIYLDIKESDYIYETDNYILKFSSNFYKENYINNYNYYVEMELRKLENKYGIFPFCLLTEFRKFLEISYYHKIEKRGSYYYDKVRSKWL